MCKLTKTHDELCIVHKKCEHKIRRMKKMSLDLIQNVMKKIFTETPPSQQQQKQPVVLPIPTPTSSPQQQQQQKKTICSSQKITLLNSGSYGCVQCPTITKKTNKSIKYSSQFITKIQLNDKLLENEMSISNKVMNIHNYKHYFSPITKQCDAMTMPTPEIMQNCFPNTEQTTKYTCTQLRLVGEENIETHIKHIQPKTIAELKTQCYYYYLLKSISKLNEQGIIHNNLKENNIIHDIKLNAPIIINFQSSFCTDDATINNAQTINNIFYTTEFYPYWCIDHHMICHAIKEKNRKKHPTVIKEKTMNDIINNYFNNLEEYLKQHFNSQLSSLNFVKEMKQQHRNYFNQFIGKQWEKMMNELLTTTVMTTWDNYSLSMTFLTMNIKSLPSIVSSHCIEVITAIPTERKNGLQSLQEFYIPLLPRATQE